MSNKESKTINPNPPADFQPERQPFTPLRPFRFWCQKVLPLVYDDSLSYYELLCKVVDYLNKTMEDVDNFNTDMTSLYDTYEQLQEYVNNYFSSLDVQTEINNKLDEMSSNGTLLSIISETVVNEVDSHIDKMATDGSLLEVIDDTVINTTENKVNDLAEDGTITRLLNQIVADNTYPTFVDSTGDMTNHDTVYVNTTNGHLYFYNGSAFVDSGLTYGAFGAYAPSNVRINASILPYNNADDLPGGYTYLIEDNVTEEMVANLPVYGEYALLSSFNFSRTTNNGKYQIFVVEINDETEPRVFFRTEFGTGTPYTFSPWVEMASTLNVYQPSQLIFLDDSPYNSADLFPDGKTIIVGERITEEQIANLPMYGEYMIITTINYSTNINHGKYQLCLVELDDKKEPLLFFRTEFGNFGADLSFSPWSEVFRKSDYVEPVIPEPEYSAGLSAFDNIVSVGDSLSCGYQRINNEIISNNYNYSPFQYFVKKYGTKVYWAGASGITTTEFLSANGNYNITPYAGTRGMPYLKSLGKKALYIISLGTNDSGGGEQHVNIGSSDTINDPTTFYGAYNEIIKEIHEFAPSAYILCVSGFNVNVNEDYKITAPKYVADLYPEYCLFINIDEELRKIQNTTRDGHYTCEGYYSIGEIIDRKAGLAIRNNNNWNDIANANANSEPTEIDPYEKA